MLTVADAQQLAEAQIDAAIRGCNERIATLTAERQHWIDEKLALGLSA